MNPGKVPMFTTSALRLILDYADSVDKAIELVQQFNLNSLGNFHIAVGDRTGKMAVIEYQTVITTTLETQRHITMLADADKKVVTNHFLFDGAPAAKNPGSLERYATIHDALTENPTMYKYQVAQVLKSVQQDNPDKKHYTRWSVVYDLDECSASIFIRDGEIMAFNHPYLYDVWGYNGSIYLPFPNEDVMAIGNRNELALA